MKRKAVKACEQDVVEARRWYVYLQRPGATSWWKRNMRRRERRQGHREEADLSS